MSKKYACCGQPEEVQTLFLNVYAVRLISKVLLMVVKHKGNWEKEGMCCGGNKMSW